MARRFGAVAAALLAAGAASARAGEAAPGAKRPRIAVVIDDFGLTYPRNVPDDKWMKAPWPLTFAVMPRSPRTREAARRTVESGKELIIHFPFDPFLSLDLGAEEASASDREKVRALLAESLEAIPGAAGLNNHRSLGATRNRALMRWFMGEIRGKGLYFLDSRVSPRSVAFEEARAAGLPASRNDVFLDEARRHDKPFCAAMLRRAAARARRVGSAVAIGHHYFQGTYDCLAEGVPRLQSEGVVFVPASELAREGGAAP